MSASGTFTLGFGSRPGFALRFCLALAPPRLRRSPRPASARRPVLPYVLGAGKTFVPPAPLGSRQLPTLPSRSQLSTISVWRLNFCVRYGYRWCPPAIVTGNFPFGALSIASRPLRFALRFRFAHSPLLSLPLPAPSKLHRSELTRKHSLIFAFPLALRALRFLRFPGLRFLRSLSSLPQIKPSTD